jgi:hypothetical protein
MEVLAWDSDHFGFPVARLTDPGMDPKALRDALEATQGRGVRLMYWSAAPKGKTAMWELAGRSSSTWRRTKILRHGLYGVLFTDRATDRRDKTPPLANVVASHHAGRSG